MRPIKRGSTDQSVVLRIIDSGDGTPELSVSSGTTGLDLWYRRDGLSLTDITETSLAAVNSAHADGGFIAIDDGYYRLDVPDAAFASSVGVNGVLIGGAVTSMIVMGTYCPLVSYDPYGTVFLATGGIAASSFAAGAVDSTALGVSLADILADTNELQGDWTNGGRLDLIIDSILVDTGTSLVTMLTSAGVNITSLIAHATTQNVALASILTYTDATVSSRASASAYTSARAGYLDLLLSYLDASVSTVDSVVDTINTQMAQGIIANASLDNVEFPMVDETDHRSPKTGLTVLGYASINGAAFASLSAAVAEVGNGIYAIDLLPADTNGGIITYRFSATGADDSYLTIRTTSG